MPTENEQKIEKVEVDPAPAQKADETVAGLAKALKEQRENSVSKEEFAKLKEENTELMKAIIDGSPVGSKGDTTEKPADLRALAKDLCEGGIGNLEYAKRSLKFRDEYIKKYEKDPFAPNNDKMTQDDVEQAEKVATAMKECIEQADGSETMFNALLTERIKNDSPQMVAMLKKKGFL